jgi:hypothetical protein
VIHANQTYGNTFDLGDFNLCLKIHHETEDAGMIKGQHCLFQYYSKSNTTIAKGAEFSPINLGWKKLNRRFGGAVCLPSSCSPANVKSILNILLKETGFKVANDYDQSDYCKRLNPREKMSKYSVLVITVTVLLVLLVIISSCYDYHTREAKNDKLRELLTSFSLPKTFSTFINSNVDGKNEVQFFNMLRSFMSITVILCHCFVFSTFFPSNDFPDVVSGKSLHMLLLVAGIINVFFIMSGFLVMTSIKSRIEK